MVTMGCKDICPFVPAKRYIEWGLDDPKGKGLDFFRHTRDEIEGFIIDLLNNITLEEERYGKTF